MAAVLSFSLLALPRQARGTLLTTTSVCGTTTVVAVVVVVIVLVTKKPKPQPQPEPGDLVRAMLDAGMLTVRGDLGTELSLLVQSPQAYDQLADELSRGEGPGLDALVHATGLSPAELATHWQANAQHSGLVTDSSTAMRFTANYMLRLAPHLTVPGEVQTTLLWQLQRERLEHTSLDEAPTHAWLARWLGVSPTALAGATSVALHDLDGLSEAEQRARLTRRSSDYLDALARHVELNHPTEVSVKMAEFMAEAAPWLPAELSET